MNKFTLSMFALVLSVLSTHASATLMTVETRSINAAIDDTDFVGSWGAQTSAITTSILPEFNQFYSGSHTISHLSIELTSAINGSWGIEAGLDAGYGAALFVDGNLIENRTDDLWWSYNWNSSDVLSGTSGISAGNHTIDLYWAENCCNGYSSGRFTTDNGNTWQTLSVTNIDAATVSEPANLALFGLGLLGLAGARRFK